MEEAQRQLDVGRWVSRGMKSLSLPPLPSGLCRIFTAHSAHAPIQTVPHGSPRGAHVRTLRIRAARMKEDPPHIYLTTYRSLYLPLSTYLHLSLYLPVSILTCLPIYLHVYLSLSLPTYLSTYLSLHLPISLPTYLCTYLYLHLLICAPTYPSIYLSLHLPMFAPTYRCTYLSPYFWLL